MKNLATLAIAFSFLMLAPSGVQAEELPAETAQTQTIAELNTIERNQFRVQAKQRMRAFLAQKQNLVKGIVEPKPEIEIEVVIQEEPVIEIVWAAQRSQSKMAKYNLTN
jgi:hypothetical protein